MTRIKLSFTFLVLLPAMLFSQAESIINGISMESPAIMVMAKIKAISESTKLITIQQPRFPMAKNSEQHLLGTNIKTENGTIDRAVFTFADDKLVYIETRGNSEEVFVAHRSDTARTYLDYKVYSREGLFIDTKKDITHILTDEGMHLNLFTWENPYFQPEYMTPAEFNKEVPAFLEMGATLEMIRPMLEANSAFVVEEELDGADPNAQLQLNGFGVEYMGFPRKVEARFGDEMLNVVWILTGKGEEDRIRQALVAEFGEPVFTSLEWEIYNNWTVGLRKDKPEVLLMRQEIGLQYKTSYFKQ